jgi:transposase
MAFREVRVFEVREALRLWLAGESLRGIERLAGLDRKTIRRYIEAAQAAGVLVGGGEAELSDELIGQVVEAVRPHRLDGHGQAWRLLGQHHDQITEWVEADLTAVKIADLLGRRGVVVPRRTVQRYVLQVCGRSRGQGTTVRIADGQPGDECQIDFGRMGLVPDSATGRNRVTYALIFTACYSRHQFVWLTHRQTTEAVIEGCEQAWGFFGGVFRTVIPDNMEAIVDDADAIEPRINQAFAEYAQARGFRIDPTRVRHPKDKPRVERAVPYVRRSMFAGETFVDLAQARRHATEWCATTAGLRVHGTIQARPVEVFVAEEQPLLGPAPAAPYDLPHYGTAKVHRDHHIEVARALYSLPTRFIGQRVQVRADRDLVRVFHRGQLVKVHPRQAPGGRCTDPEDLPAEKTVYAMRDLTRLQAMAAGNGAAIGAYAAALLDVPLPWTRMRSVYALLGLVRRWGAERVETACATALELEVVNVRLIGRMLEQGRETTVVQPSLPGTLITARFARDPAHFAVTASDRPHLSIDPDDSGALEANLEDGFSTDSARGAR